MVEETGMNHKDIAVEEYYRIAGPDRADKGLLCEGECLALCRDVLGDGLGFRGPKEGEISIGHGRDHPPARVGQADVNNKQRKRREPPPARYAREQVVESELITVINNGGGTACPPGPPYL